MSSGDIISPWLIKPDRPRATSPRSVMDEQAGPGVLFSSSSVRAPQPGEAAGGGEAAKAQYCIPGILHFLQHEWARFEVERAQWEVERAELQVRRRDLRLFVSSASCQTALGNWIIYVVIVCRRIFAPDKASNPTRVFWHGSTLNSALMSFSKIDYS